MSKYYKIREDQLQRLVKEPLEQTLRDYNIDYSVTESNDKHCIVAIRSCHAVEFIQHMKHCGYICQFTDEWEVVHITTPEEAKVNIRDNEIVKLLQEFYDNDISDDKTQ